MADEIKDVPGPEVLGEAGGAEDAAADSEAVAIAAGNLKEISERNEHTRRESFLDQLAIGASSIFWLLIATTAFSIFAVAVHNLTAWAWLTEKQLAAVETFIFSGAVLAALGGYVSRYMG